jgi:DNA-binding MarR family transcriptional regulator
VNTRMDRRRLAAWRDFFVAYHQIIPQLEHEMAEAVDLTLSQYDVLLRLSEAPGGRMRMSGLAEAIVYSTGGLSRLIERMCRAGLTRREYEPDDRRVVYAVLTDEGATRLRAASKVHLDGVRRHFARHLRDDELDAVADFLFRLSSGSVNCDIEWAASDAS